MSLLSRSRPSLLPTLALVALGASAAQAQVTVNFENLSNPSNGGFTAQGNTVSQNGFTFTNLSGGAGFATIAPNSASNYTGSVALTNNTVLGITRLTQNNGNTFTLNFLGIANTSRQSSNPGTAGGVTFTGNVQGGATVTQTFSLAANDALQPFTFDSSFTNLVSVTYQRTTAAIQIDNVLITPTATAPTAVPEPGEWAIMGMLGTSVCGLMIRARRKAGTISKKAPATV